MSQQSKLSVRDIDVHGKRVLVRVDFNVPVDDHLCITDDTRISESLPTLELLRKNEARLILLAHFGRPKGKVVEKYSLKPVFERLRTLIGGNVSFSPNCVGPAAEAATHALQDGDILLMENVRFHAEEEANDPAFAAQLAKLGDLYVNDAFGAAHRAHASTEGVTRYFPQAAMGLLLEKEIKYLQGELENPRKPFLVILGGSKVSDKIGVIKALMEKADIFLIGGAMAYTFLKAQGIEVANSRVEEDKLDLARELLNLAASKGLKFLLPIDCIETQEIKSAATWNNTQPFPPGKGVTASWMGVDIGIKTRALYSAEIAQAATILWNGPVGVFEIAEFSGGTRALAEAIAANSSATSIIGGGDSVTAVKQFGLANKMTFISTGGGASLELLEGRVLPGIAALTNKK